MKRSFDYIHLLCAGIKQNDTGRWVSTDLSEKDIAFGAPGGKLRVLATAVLARELPETLIFTGGGKGYGVPLGAPEDRPLLAEILRDELRDAGAPLERIVLERESNTTYQELQELAKLIEREGCKFVAVVTNRWHVSRTQAILEIKFPKLREKAAIEVVAAEDVLLQDDRVYWEGTIESAYNSAWMKKLSDMEENGRRQIVDGTYQFK